MSREPRELETDEFADNAIWSRANNDGNRIVTTFGIDPEVVRSDRAEQRANEISLVRTKLASSADGHLSRAAKKLLDTAGGTDYRLSDSDYTAFSRAATHAVRLSAMDRELATLEKQYRSRVSVVGDVDPYGAGSDASWIFDSIDALDAANSTVADRVRPGREERLARHGRIAARAVAERTEYGKALEAAYVADYRQQDVYLNKQTAEKRLKEFRGLVTGGGATASASGGAAAFLPPAILLNEYATYRSPSRVVADLLDSSVDLPPFGLHVYVPQITGGTSVTDTTEGSATAEADPTVTYISEAVAEKSGQVTLSQAVVDRVGPGISADVFLFQQLKSQLGAQIDLVAITALLAGANTVTNSGAFAFGGTSTVAGFMANLKAAKSKTTDTAGTRIRSSVLVTASDFADYLQSYTDANGRPVFEPDDNADDLPEGDTGYRIASLRHWADDNIPTLTTSNFLQLIVTQPKYTLLLEGAPVVRLFPQYGAGNLDPIIAVRSYVACVPRYPAAVSVISGSAYAASTFA